MHCSPKDNEQDTAIDDVFAADPRNTLDAIVTVF